VSSEPGAERGIQTKQTQFAVCVPSRSEGERCEQARRDSRKRLSRCEQRAWSGARNYFAAPAASPFWHSPKGTKRLSGVCSGKAQALLFAAPPNPRFYGGRFKAVFGSMFGTDGIGKGCASIIAAALLSRRKALLLPANDASCVVFSNCGAHAEGGRSRTAPVSCIGYCGGAASWRW